MLRTIEIKQSVFESNDRVADALRAELRERGALFAEPHVLARLGQDDDAG